MVLDSSVLAPKKKETTLVGPGGSRLKARAEFLGEWLQNSTPTPNQKQEDIATVEEYYSEDENSSGSLLPLHILIKQPKLEPKVLQKKYKGSEVGKGDILHPLRDQGPVPSPNINMTITRLESGVVPPITAPELMANIIYTIK